MELESILMVSRGALLLASFVILASHSGTGLHWKPHVSLLAVLLAGSSLGLALMTFFGLSGSVPAPQWLINVYALAIFLACVGCRGNVARLNPFRYWRRV